MYDKQDPVPVFRKSEEEKRKTSRLSAFQKILFVKLILQCQKRA